MSPSENVADEAESMFQPDHAQKADKTEGSPFAFDVNDSQDSMNDRPLVRRVRKVVVRGESDGTTQTVQKTVYDLSPGPEALDASDRLTPFPPYPMTTTPNRFGLPFDSHQTHNTALSTPYHSPQAALLEGKSKMITADEESNHLRHFEPRHTWRRFVCILGLSLLNLMCGSSVTLPATALTTIAHGTNATVVQASWIPGSLLLTGSLFQPLLMRLSHVTGCRPLVHSGVSIFTMMSLVSAYPGKNIITLIFQRSIAGFGFASIRTLTPLILAQLVQYDHKKWYETWPSQFFWLGASIGPLIGAVVVQFLPWQVLFCVEWTMAIFGLALLSFFERQPVEGAVSRANLKKIDYLGWLALSTAITTAAIVFSQVDSALLWSSWWGWSGLLVAFLPTIVWCYYSGHLDEPIIPVSIFRDRRAIAACIAVFFQNLLLVAVIYLVPIYISTVHDLSALECALQVSSWTLPAFFAGLFIAQGLHGKTTTTPHVFSACVCLSGLAGLDIILGLGHTAWLIHAGAQKLAGLDALFTGLGFGILTPILSAILQIATSSDDETIHALPLHNFVGSLGLLSGVMVGSAVPLN